jgi:hypothetical protein
MFRNSRVFPSPSLVGEVIKVEFLLLRFLFRCEVFNMSGLGDSSSDPANPDSHKRKGSPCDTLASR